jgi:hypothetical protein
LGPGDDKRRPALAVFVPLANPFFALPQLLGGLPENITKFMCAYGVWTVLDPFVILIVDLLSHNYRCGEVPGCRDDYTSTSCSCFNGDWFKLWARYHRDEGSGATGLFITFMIYFATVIISSLLFYEYLVRIHRDGRYDFK